MTPEEYAYLQSVISASVANYASRFAQFFAGPALTVQSWLQLLELVFPEIRRRREESADLARRFYDSQRALEYPQIPRNPVLLETSKFEWFVESMEPARKKLSLEASTPDAVAMFALRAVRDVENAGRRQIIKSVEQDQEPRIIRGWARVATGRETCAWCLMLISRGPTYLGSDTAGLNLSEDEATRIFNSSSDIETYFADISEHMEEWHAGCDCKVIPVFRYEGWFGQEAADRALDLWKSASKEAGRLIESGEARTDNRNTEAINALRRRLYRGEIDINETAALAA